MSAPGQLRQNVEASVIARCQDGDREAFGWIVEEYADVLYGSAVLMTRDFHLAEDIVQETFLSAWKSISSFERGRPFRPWIMRILVNHVRMRARRKRPETAPLDPERTAAPAADMTRIETRDTLRRALAALPEEQRELMVLRYFAGLTVPEIARATGRREGTVKSRIHRGLERMRERLMKEESDER